MTFPNNLTLAQSEDYHFKDPQVHVVPAGHGYAFEVQAERHFRVVDLYGQQVVDFAACVKSTSLTQKLSMAYSRYHLNGVAPAVGEHLWSNTDEPLLEVVSDTVKVHDMTFMSCFPELYEKRGLTGHRSCASNIAEVMKPYGMDSYLDVTDPFNIFQNTPNYSLKPMNPSKAGDYIQFKALKSLIVAVSCCPYDIAGFNGGRITDIAIVTDVFSKGSAPQADS